MAEINPLRLRHIVWKTKRKQRMAVIVNTLHALIALSCFCLMHVDTNYDWGLTKALRTSSNGSEIREKMDVIAKSEGYKSAEDFIWRRMLLARAVSVVKQVSFGYCLLSVLKLITRFPMWAPTQATDERKDYLPRPGDKYMCAQMWHFESACNCFVALVYLVSCGSMAFAQYNDKKLKLLWSFSFGGALGFVQVMLISLCDFYCERKQDESTESPD